MVVCINPSEQDYEKNLQVLKFAEMTEEAIKAEPRYLQFKTPLKAAPVQTPKTTGLENSSLVGPSIPSIEFNVEDVDALQTNLGKHIRCLQARKTKALTNEIEFKSYEEAFRKRLSTINYGSVLETDGDGDLKTKLNKGDIVPTCSGEAQVIFNGVECLRQKSPTKVPLSPNK